MKYFLLIILFLQISCSTPVEKEKVCIRLYMQYGYVKVKCYDLQKGVDIYLSDDMLVYTTKGVFFETKIIKRQVVDFEILRK